MQFDKVDVDIFLNNTWYDLENIVSSNGIRLTPRIDGTFMVGTFDAWLSDKSIPAYTPIRIFYDNYQNTIYAVVTSTSNKFLPEENTYYHTFDVFESTAILSNFVVGSKSFSVTGTNQLDKDKIKILIELMQQKYGITVSYNDSDLNTFNKSREFAFGAGSTLYNALVEIMAEYNCIPYVTEILSNTSFTLSFINKNNSTSINYSNNEITNVVRSQNLDNYCKFLETEASNVVDRTTTTTWENLSVRAEDILINADKCCLVLPTNVEKITSIKTNGLTWGFKVDLDEHLYYDYPNLISNYTDGVGNTGVINKPFDLIFYYFAEATGDLGEITQDDVEWTSLYRLLHKLFYDMDGVNYTYSQLCNKLDGITWTADIINDNEHYFYRISASYLFMNSDYSTFLDVTSYLLEKNEWESLDIAEKPKYMYYESGTNIIKGMYNFYKDDFWGQITGQQIGAWFTYVTGDEYNESLNSDYSTGYAQKSIAAGYNPMNALFNVTANVKVNPVIYNEKSIQPLNESVWKPYARSYNNSAAVIEFDKLEERMQISNNMLGDVELQLEMTNPAFIPLISETDVYKITYDSTDYYVTNYVIHITADNVIIVYSLSRTQSKVADVIGVETQFEATPNPLTGVITRPIYIEATTGKNLDLNEYNFLLFRFECRNDGTTSYHLLFKRFSILESNNTKLLYCETVDQFTFDYNMVQAYGTNYYRNPISYVSDYNEAYSVAVSLVKLNLDLTKSRNLPLVSNWNNTVISQVPLVEITTNNFTSNKEIKIYKDARERLTFTIKLN